MLFADWALGLTHSIRAIKGHCSTGGKKTCFVGILLHTQSVHTDSQKHTWHTQTPRHTHLHNDMPTTMLHREKFQILSATFSSKFTIYSMKSFVHLVSKAISTPQWAFGNHFVGLWLSESHHGYHHFNISSYPFYCVRIKLCCWVCPKNTLFSSWRQNMNNRILEVHQDQYIVVM